MSHHQDQAPCAPVVPRWAADVLHFWFEEVQPEQWFKRDAALDGELRTRFLSVHERVSEMPDTALLSDAETALAAVIVLDQFSRNMFRDTPRAFASDGRALALAEAAISRGYEGALDKNRRLFLYLPLEHCEDRAVQARCVALMAGLGDPELTRYAEAHRAIIERFGRFPHRNAILGRVSTAEESEFLKQPGSAF